MRHRWTNHLDLAKFARTGHPDCSSIFAPTTWRIHAAQYLGPLYAPRNTQVVTACPEIMIHERGSSGKEELLLLACDGVWDVLSNQDAGEFLAAELQDCPLGEVLAAS